MTEAEWLAATDPRALFHWLRRSGTAERQRLGLLFVACCDRIPPSVTAASSQGSAASWGNDPDDQIALTDAEFHLSGAVLEAMRVIGNGEREQVALVALIRDIFGNPFGPPVCFSPEWRTDTAMSLARMMYESRE